MLFIGYLIENKKQSQMVKSYISAIRGVLAEIKVTLNEDQFLLNALTRACKFKNDVANMRLPIRKGMLQVLIHHTFQHFVMKQPYLVHLYTTLFSTSYYGLFRVGELTSGTHPVKVADIHIARNKKKMLSSLGLPKHMEIH